LTISDVIFDALQQADPRWIQDSALTPGSDGAYGYNFAWMVPASLLAYTNTFDVQDNPVTHRIRADVKFTPVTGEPFVVPFEFPAVPVFTS
jgi:hypothetical protein